MNRTQLILSTATVLLFGSAASAQFLPIYSANPARRARQLGVTSENLRNAAGDWERIWFLDQPSSLTPYRTGGFPIPYSPVGRGGSVGRSRFGGGITGTGRSGAGGISGVRSAPRAIAASEPEPPKKTEAEKMLEMYARGEKAEQAGKDNIAKIYYRVVANNADGPIQEAAATKLALLQASVSR